MQIFSKTCQYIVARMAAMLLGFATLNTGWAQSSIDPATLIHATPNVFVQTITDQALTALQQNTAAQTDDAQALRKIIDRYILPYMNMEKTTRLAAGRHWRQATAAQRQQLVEAFTGTLIRTYSSAFHQIAPNTRLTILPYRGDPKATDAVVRSTITRDTGAPVAVDYRLEKTPQGWKIYDLNVEGIWLIQNYRNQFAQEITAHGIDGLIAALNQRNS